MIVWKLERGNFVVGRNPLVAVVEIGDCTIDLLPTLYGIKGKLFTPNLGISKLIRNVLRAGTIRYLFIVGDRDVPHFFPRQALKALFENGVDEGLRIIGAVGFNPVLSGVTREDVEEFRRRIVLYDLLGAPRERIIEVIRALAGERNEEIRVEFVEEELAPYPRLVCGVLVRARDIVEAWKLAVRHVVLFGTRVESERGPTRELLNLVVHIEDPRPRPFPGIPLEALEEYVRSSFMSPDARGSEYTYGERLWRFAGLEELIEKLRRSPVTRRAVAVLWDPARDVSSHSPPCMCLVQFLVRGGRLYVTAVFRSHDVGSAYPFNLYGLAKLTESVCSRLSLSPGALVVHSVSAHVYEHDLARLGVSRVVECRDWTFVPDQMGWFNVYEREGRLVAEHYSPDGRLLEVFEAEDGDGLEHAIALHVQGLRPEHYIWIGREIGKIEATSRKPSASRRVT